jgi:hypothetical protein
MATPTRRRTPGRLPTAIAVGVALVLASATAVSGAIASGSLPAAAFTYLSVTDNAVNMGPAGDAVRLKIKDSVTVKTTYSMVVPGTGLVGTWHYHNGPVIVTVTVGTLTFYDSTCGTWDVEQGHTYIESTGQVLVAKALPSKNTTNVEWFTTRLYPAGTNDPVNVAAPCTPA